MFTWYKINVYRECIYFDFYIHTHSWCKGDGHFGGKLTPVTVMFKGDISQGNHNTKNSYTHKESCYSLHKETHPIPWTQNCTANHSAPSSWNYSKALSLYLYCSLSTGPLCSFPAGITNQFHLYTKAGWKPQLSCQQSISSPSKWF